MLTKFSKWIIYCASYFPMYLLLVLPILFASQKSVELFWQVVIDNWNLSWPLLTILIALFIMSLGIIFFIPKLKPNTRVYGKLINNATGEMAAFFIPFIITFLTINMNWYGWIISVFIYFLCGAIVVQADFIHLCPAFFFARYKLFKDENGKFILTRLKREQVNQILLESANGMEATALTPNLYIIEQKYF